MTKILVPIITLLFLVTSCKNGSEKTNDTKIVTDTSSSKLNSAEFKRVNDLLKANPNNPDLYYERGLAYLNIKDFEASIADVNRALKMDSLKDKYYLLLTDAYFFSDKTRKAKETLEKCIEKIPTSADAYMKLAELYFYVKKYQESINNINNALKINENMAKGYFLKGMCYKESGDSTKALSSFQTACEQDDKYYDAYIETGMLLASKHNVLAIEYYNNALRINPKSTEVVYLVGKFYQDNNKIPQAVDAYNKLLSVDKKNKNALYNLGVINYINLKDVEKAKNYFSQAIDADDEYAEAYLARGICFEDLKAYDDAEADYKAALQYKKNFELAIYHLNRLIDKRKGKSLVTIYLTR